MDRVEPAPRARLGRVADVLRHGVRQLATAVYVYVAFAMAARSMQGSPAAMLAAELALVLVGTMLLTRLVDAPLAGTALVGVFVAAFDVGLAIIGHPEDADAGYWGLVAAHAAAVVLAGVLGAVAVRARRRPKGRSPDSSDDDAPSP